MRSEVPGKDIEFIRRITEKTKNVIKEAGVAVQLDAPAGAEDKFKKAFNDAFESAMKSSGINVKYDEAKLTKASQSIANTIKEDIEDLKLPQHSWIAQRFAAKPVKGIECIPICTAICAMTVGVGSVAAGAAGWAGGCVAVCALTAELAVVIAGAA